MIKDLPYGPLINSSDTNLNNYFGYCYASVNIPKEVIAPILPFRTDNVGLGGVGDG